MKKEKRKMEATKRKQKSQHLQMIGEMEEIQNEWRLKDRVERREKEADGRIATFA